MREIGLRCIKTLSCHGNNLVPPIVRTLSCHGNSLVPPVVRTLSCHGNSLAYPLTVPAIFLISRQQKMINTREVGLLPRLGKVAPVFHHNLAEPFLLLGRVFCRSRTAHYLMSGVLTEKTATGQEAKHREPHPSQRDAINPQYEHYSVLCVTVDYEDLHQGCTTLQVFGPTNHLSLQKLEN